MKRLKENYDTISFDSCGWMIAYHLGVAEFLKSHYDLSEISMHGVSGGALVGGILLCDHVDFQYVIRHILSYQKYAKYNPFLISKHVNNTLCLFTPNDINTITSNRLSIALSELSTNGLSRKYVNEFDNKEDFINKLNATCWIPLISNVLPYQIDQKYYYDGGVTGNMLIRNDKHQRTLYISCYPYNSYECQVNICPSFHIPRIWYIFTPSFNTLMCIKKLGYLDAHSFFHKDDENSFQEKIDILSELNKEANILPLVLFVILVFLFYVFLIHMKKVFCILCVYILYVYLKSIITSNI